MSKLTKTQQAALAFLKARASDTYYQTKRDGVACVAVYPGLGRFKSPTWLAVFETLSDVTCEAEVVTWRRPRGVRHYSACDVIWFVPVSELA